MYGAFPGAGMPNAPNPNMNPGSRYFQPYNSGPMFPNMGMQPRQPLSRWGNMNAANGPAPGAPPTGMRPAGGMVGFPPSMMRPMNLPQTGIQQRFMGPPPTGQSNFPGQGQQPQSGAPRGPIGGSQNATVMQMSMNNQVGAGNAPRISGPTPNVSNAGALTGQVQYAMTARNIQPPAQQQNVPLNPSSSAAARVSAPPSQPAGQPPVDGPNLESMPIDKFVTLVQNADASSQKQVLGEKIYSIIRQWYPDAAGKLTGMLLEIENRELLGLIAEYRDDSQESGLRRKVDSALQVLESSKHTAKDASVRPKGGE